MTLRLTFIFSLIAAANLGLVGCNLAGTGSNKSKPFAKGEQWEPEVTEQKKSDWRSEPSGLRSPKDKASNEDPLDKLIWSSEAREINRNLGGSL